MWACTVVGDCFMNKLGPTTMLNAIQIEIRSGAQNVRRQYMADASRRSKPSSDSFYVTTKCGWAHLYFNYLVLSYAVAGPICVKRARSIKYEMLKI